MPKLKEGAMNIIEWMKQMWIKKISLSGMTADMNDTDFMVEAPKNEIRPRPTCSSVNDDPGCPVQTAVWKRPANMRTAGKMSIS